ncbi:Mitochondrial import inner membrane translocase subunit [Vigna angularis]|uniref:Mitochondrial import inner membrane translocase subunit n=1 Tax=Phaseolus angularis TaxID=3914 RepID=A0A8T0L4U4_PHAAN|nr:Mitochondrial import inner membrane translocase subunit [Vigna angularis]
MPQPLPHQPRRPPKTENQGGADRHQGQRRRLLRPLSPSLLRARASAKPFLPTRAYDPYKDLDAPIRNLYHLPTSPEFLFVEEARRKRRSWGENLTFYTRCGYLAGAIGGAGSGLVEGVKAFESGDTMKLRINRVLNAAGHSGRVWGNRVGILGLLYAKIESRIQAARDADDV